MFISTWPSYYKNDTTLNFHLRCIFIALYSTFNEIGKPILLTAKDNDLVCMLSAYVLLMNSIYSLQT